MFLRKKKIKNIPKKIKFFILIGKVVVVLALIKVVEPDTRLGRVGA